MIADTLRLEEKNYRNIETLMQLLKASGPDATSQELYENAVEADRGIILLYKNLCEAWAECQNLFKKADDKINAVKEESDKYHEELNDKIDEVNNYLNSLIRELEGRIDTAEGDIEALEGHVEDAVSQINSVVQTLHRIINYPTDTPNNVISISPKFGSNRDGYTVLATDKEYHGTDPITYDEQNIKLPFVGIYGRDTYTHGNWSRKSPYEVYWDNVTNKYHPVYIVYDTEYIDTSAAIWGTKQVSVTVGNSVVARIIDVYATVRAKIPGNWPEKVFRLTKGIDLGSIGTHTTVCGGFAGAYEDGGASITFIADMNESKDLVADDPTHYSLPEYYKIEFFAKVADLGEEITL